MKQGRKERGAVIVSPENEAPADNPSGPAADPLVIGVGNRFRRDDGAGPAAVDALLQTLRETPAAEIIAVDGDGATLATLWEDRATVIVIDAVRSGGVPGSIRRIDAGAGPLPTGCGFFSSHAFGLAEAIETARALGKLPPRLTVYGVEGGDFGWGESLSPAVAAALPRLCAAVLAEISRKDEATCSNGSVS